jgi:micrococcal nuclease
MNKMLVLGFAFILITVDSWAARVSGKVTSIHDGDTLTIQEPGQPRRSRVRLFGVDTPEVDFMGATQGESAILARDYLRSLLPMGAEVELELSTQGQDRNGRYLAIVHFQGKDINAEMLKSGWASFYVIFPYDKDHIRTYSDLSREAFDARRGIFSALYASDPLPYVFRQDQRAFEGTYLIGDLRTRRLYNGEKMEEVPPYARVFFSNIAIARRQGFRF